MSSQERDQEIEALAAALEEKKKVNEAAPMTAPLGDSDGPRRSQRLTTQNELGRLRAELDQCRAELFTKTHGRV